MLLWWEAVNPQAHRNVNAVPVYFWITPMSYATQPTHILGEDKQNVSWTSLETLGDGSRLCEWKTVKEDVLININLDIKSN